MATHMFGFSYFTFGKGEKKLFGQELFIKQFDREVFFKSKKKTQQPDLVPLGETLKEAESKRSIANNSSTFLNFPSSTNFLRGA